MTHPPFELDVRDELSCELLVVGAGIAGMTAALQAGRLGLDTILIERDDVLGGCGGPNLGVPWSGAQSHHDYAAETGIVMEIEEEIAWRGGTTVCSGDPFNICRLAEAVWVEKLRQARVRLLRRHVARTALTEDRRVMGVLADDLAGCSSRLIHVTHAVLDASGDGQVAYDAGAPFRYGREARTDHGERSAPVASDDRVAGMGMAALVRRTDQEVVFVPPEPGAVGRWMPRPTGWTPEAEACFLWNTELGGTPDLDPIVHEHEIYERLLDQIYGMWSQIKNGPFARHAGSWELTWVSPKAGKRETRRFVGDLVLTQNEVEHGRTLTDRVAFGGHTLDEHEPNADGAIRVRRHSCPPLYDTAYRMTYSRDFDNLYLAGRLVSSTHTVHGSLSRIKTGALLAQATANAIYLARQHGCSARAVHDNHLDQLQQLTLREDGSIVDLLGDDPADQAPTAHVTASSEWRLDELQADQSMPLIEQPTAVFYDWPEQIDELRIWVANTSGRDATVRVTVLSGREPEQKHLTEAPAEADSHQADLFERGRCPSSWTELSSVPMLLPDGWDDWIGVPVPGPISLPARDRRLSYQVMGVRLEGPDGTTVQLDDRPCEVADWFAWRERSTAPLRLRDGALAILTTPTVRLGEAVNVLTGLSRRWGRGPTNMWISAPGAPLPQWLELRFDEPVDTETVRLTFDTLARSQRDQPPHAGRRAAATCVRDYRLQATDGVNWTDLVVVRDNYHRHRVHRLAPCATQGLRLLVEDVHDRTAGARLYEIRVEGPVDSSAPAG